LPAGKEPRNFGLHRVKQLAGVRQLTDIIQRPPTTPLPADRTWVLLTETPEGGWGLGGHASANAELVSAARAQIAELSKSSPGRSPSSHRRARREAIGLPQFGDPEDLQVVVGSARWMGARLDACHQQQVPGAYCRRSPSLQVPASSAGIQASCGTSMLYPCLGWVRPSVARTR
jgi:phenylpyruvate tautomerase PptA (4-oxalocrotonate tautomerase family)